jgi:hypothetical protein
MFWFTVFPITAGWMYQTVLGVPTKSWAMLGVVALCMFVSSMAYTAGYSKGRRYEE